MERIAPQSSVASLLLGLSAERPKENEVFASFKKIRVLYVSFSPSWRRWPSCHGPARSTATPFVCTHHLDCVVHRSEGHFWPCTVKLNTNLSVWAGPPSFYPPRKMYLTFKHVGILLENFFFGRDGRRYPPSCGELIVGWNSRKVGTSLKTRWHMERWRGWNDSEGGLFETEFPGRNLFK